MTAPEREALVSQLKYSAGADESEAHGLRRTSLNTQRALDLEMQAMLKRNAAAAIEALSDAPAVTVTEERCKAILSKALHPGLPDGMAVDLSHAGYIWDTDVILAAMMQAASEAAYQSKSEGDAVIAAVENLIDNSPIDDKDRPYISEVAFREFNALVAAFDALKSTTPQTGSQE